MEENIKPNYVMYLVGMPHETGTGGDKSLKDIGKFVKILADIGEKNIKTLTFGTTKYMQNVERISSDKKKTLYDGEYYKLIKVMK